MKRFALITIIFISLTSILKAQQVIYVDAGATGAQNGISWNDAFTNLIDAIDAAPAGAEIWVTYGGNHYVSKTKNPADKIVINKDLRIIGGFIGNETTNIPTSGNHSLINGELQPDTLTSNNSHNAFVIQANVQLEWLSFYYFNSEEDSLPYYGAIVADTNSSVTLNHTDFEYNTGKLDGVIISAHLGSQVEIKNSTINYNKVENGALFTRNDDAKITVKKSVIGANGKNTGYNYVFYTKKTGITGYHLNEELLLDVSETTFGNNKMGICFSLFGSVSFNNCPFNMEKTSDFFFNILGDSASVSMDSCSFQNIPDSVSTFISAINIKNFTFSNSSIGYSKIGITKTMSWFFDISAGGSISFINSQFWALYASNPFQIYAPNSTVLFSNCTFQGGEASSYYLNTYSKKLISESNKFLGITTALGNSLWADTAFFRSCNFTGIYGYGLTSFSYLGYTEVDSCSFLHIAQNDNLFTTYSPNELLFKNNYIEDITLATSGIEKYFFANLGGKQNIVNNTIKAVVGYGHLFYNSGQTTLFGNDFYDLSSKKPVFLNYQDLSIYNSNFDVVFAPLFQNDSLLNRNIRFNLINDVIYTLNDTVMYNSIKTNSYTESISHCFSNKKNLSGTSITIDSTISYGDFYAGNSHPYLSDKGLDLSDSTFITAFDLKGNQRIVGTAIDIGAYESTGSVTSVITNKQAAIHCYPNPSGDFTILKLDEAAELVIHGTDGRKIRTLSVEKGENIIPVSTLEKGVYIFSLNSGENFSSLLFMKQ